MKYQKERRLRRIVTSSYVPHAGYVDCVLADGRYFPTGKYIKYPKNSKRQRALKRATSRRQRRCRELPVKGNGYRRLVDYWWALY